MLWITSFCAAGKGFFHVEAHVDDGPGFPQKRQFFHFSAPRPPPGEAPSVDEFLPLPQQTGPLTRTITALHIYSPYTRLCSPRFPQNPPAVDEFQQHLSTIGGQTKKRRFWSHFSDCAGRKASMRSSYPQFVQYLWITRCVRRLLMKK